MGIRNLLKPERWRRMLLSLKYGFIVPAYDGMMNETKCRFLYDHVRRFKGEKNHIVEIGSWMGCSTTWLAVAGMRNKFKSLIAIDLFTGTPSWNTSQDTFASFMERMNKNYLTDFVRPVRGDSRAVVKQWKQDDIISILHIDGDHAYEAVKEDLQNYLPLLQSGGLIIVDDYDTCHLDVVRAVDECLAGGGFAPAGKVKEIPGEGYGSIAFRKITNETSGTYTG